ncbi:MAG: D-Ala-D-Ala carboxypeptidase family metallohydrolase [Chitinophagales bacterium]|nr:D-Ala-D-Ala carboxypeptidase family metallohydrolase [Chitinophagales bacterium]MDW8274325.1 D-Ala-D-Ala carboxypeptidase family metallohydrolase [Chitinophagales bacterium]
MQLSKNFTLAEMLRSQTATRLGYDEQFKPSGPVIANLKALCENLLQPLREQLRKSIQVTSGYRCKRLNTAIGGSAKSQHLTGQAADIVVEGLSTEQLYQRIKKSKILFDQLIQEFDQWVHISYNPSRAKNRRQCLRAVKENGKTKYLPDT